MSRPEEVGAGGNRATLVGLLEETRGGHGTVGPQRLVILVAKAVQLLKGAHDERNGRQLGTGVRHFFLVETEGLKYRRKRDKQIHKFAKKCQKSMINYAKMHLESAYLSDELVCDCL